MKTLVLALVAVVAASCGGSGVSNPPEQAPSGSTGSGLSVGVSDLGRILTDGEGYTLYLFGNDVGGSSSCYDGCVQTWPPFTQDQLGEPGTGISESLLGNTLRDDGVVQVTYNGHPLYYFIDDPAPGDANGHGIGDVWFAVTEKGHAAEQMDIPGY